MSEAAQAFARALEAERQAALRADFDALLRIQEEKRELMPLVKQSAAPELTIELAAQARKNLGLLRHLLSCVRGLVMVDGESTYTASGQSIAAPAGALRGRI
jgi:hypothetical protein